MLCYQCVETWRGVIGVTGKLKGGRFFGVVIIMQGERYSLVMKGKGHKKGCNKDS